jgi:hypothetical protein
MTLKDYLFGSPIREYPSEPYQSKLLSEDEITPQIRSDLDYGAKLSARLEFLDQQGYNKMVQIPWKGTGYGDDNITVYAHDYTSTFVKYGRSLTIFIVGKVKETNQCIQIVNSEIAFSEQKVHYDATYRDCVYDYIQHYAPIKWNCSEECKQNILKYIDDNIFNIEVTPLKDKFCSQLATEMKK